MRFESTPLHARYSISTAQDPHTSLSRLHWYYSLNHRRLGEETSPPPGTLLGAPARHTQAKVQHRLLVPALAHLRLDHGAVRHSFGARLCANRPTSILHRD